MFISPNSKHPNGDDDDDDDDDDFYPYDLGLDETFTLCECQRNHAKA